jgi:hypothetical protein
MSQQDLFEKAAECTRAIKAASDPKTLELLTILRTMWVDLANESGVLGNRAVVDQAAKMAELHAQLIGPTIH